MPQRNNQTLPTALTKCYFCQESFEIVMSTIFVSPDSERAKRFEEMNGKVINMIPCQKCQGLMKQGVIIITIDDAKSGKDWWKEKMPNPYRTGGWVVLTDEAVVQMCDAIYQPKEAEQMKEWALGNRFMFLEHWVAEKIGLFAAIKKHEEENDHGTDNPKAD